MHTFNFDKSYTQKSNAVRDMRAAVKAGQFRTEELEVVVVPAGWQIVRQERIAEAMDVPRETVRNVVERFGQKRSDAEMPKPDREPPRAPRDAEAAEVVAPATSTPTGLSAAATAVLRALVRANVWKERGLRPAERVGVWVRSANVHDSATPHGLEMRQVPPAVAALKRAGMVECGFDKSPTVRLTAAGLAAVQASR